MKTIQIDKDIRDYLVSKGMGAGQTAADILRRELLFTVEIDDDLFAFLTSLAGGGESLANVLRRELHIQGAQPGPGEPHPDDPHPDNPLPGGQIEFHIAAGTGGAPWNTADHPVVGLIGQTLRIFNDDAVGHRLHADGIPFAHGGGDIPPGGFSDVVLKGPYDPNAQTPVYDHDFGQAARFWIKVLAA